MNKIPLTEEQLFAIERTRRQVGTIPPAELQQLVVEAVITSFNRENTIQDLLKQNLELLEQNYKLAEILELANIKDAFIDAIRKYKEIMHK